MADALDPKTMADLARLMTDRVGDAMRSVMQLGATPEQMAQLALAGMRAAIATAAGAMAAATGDSVEDAQSEELAHEVIRMGFDAKRAKEKPHA